MIECFIQDHKPAISYMRRSSGVGQVIPADPVMHASWLTLNSQYKHIFFMKLYSLPRLLYLFRLSWLKNGYREKWREKGRRRMKNNKPYKSHYAALQR